MNTPLDFQPCPICHKPLGDNPRMAAIDRETSESLYVHRRGECWERRHELKASHPTATIVGERDVKPGLLIQTIA